MILPHVELRSQSSQAESEDSVDFRGGMCDPAKDSPAGTESELGFEIRCPSYNDSRESSPRHGNSHTVATRRQPTRPRGLGIAHPAIEVGRKRHYSACADEDVSIQSPEISVGNCYIPMISQVMRGFMTTSLLSDGSSRYINSVLQAQVWTSIMTTDLDLDTWGA